MMYHASFYDKADGTVDAVIYVGEPIHRRVAGTFADVDEAMLAVLAFSWALEESPIVEEVAAQN